MKKLFAFLICAIMCVMLLSSCQLAHTALDIGEHTYEYIQYEEGHFKQYTCGCPSPEIIGQHTDADENYICDICGRKEEYIFVLNYDKTGYILSDIGPGYIGGDVVIPSTYRGLPVVEIEMYAFGNCKDNLTSVTIPGSVKEIGMKAFAKQDNLETVIINGSAIVGVQSFYLCPKLKTVVIGEGTEYIYASAFEQCDSLESVTIANTVKKITGNVFAHCKNLKTITIPASVEEIGWTCFIGSGFTDIYFEMSAPGESWDEEWDYGLYTDEEIGQETNVDLHWAETEEDDNQDDSNDILYTASYPQDFEYNGRHYRLVQGDGLKTIATQEEVGELLGYIIREEDVSAFTQDYPSVDYVIDNGIYDYYTKNRVAFYNVKEYSDLSFICMNQHGIYVLFQDITNLLT